MRREIMQAFLHAHGPQVRNIFHTQQLHALQRTDILQCTQAENSNNWRLTNEQKKLYPLSGICGLKTQMQRFSVQWKTVMLTQRMLDSVCNHTGQQEVLVVDATFKDPRDAYEVFRSLNALYSSV